MACDCKSVRVMRAFASRQGGQKGKEGWWHTEKQKKGAPGSAKDKGNFIQRKAANIIRNIKRRFIKRERRQQTA
jgi:hypothetical protein